MVGGGETYFAAFVLTIGGKDLAGGLVSSVPLLAGAILQLSAPALARRMGSPRRWVMTCAAVQCLSFVPLVVGALMGGLPLWVAFTAISLYWAAALGAGPTWSTWVAAAFPARLRAVYFGQRNRLCQVVQLGGILVAGGVLALGESRGAAEGGSNGGGLLTAFAVILSLAGLSRLSSIGFLRRQDDVPPESAEEESRIGPAPLPALSVMRRITSGRELRLLTYMLVAQVTVQVAAPYFNPYMLRQLDLDKGQYLILVASLFASKSLFLPMHGEFARRHKRAHEGVVLHDDVVDQADHVDAPVLRRHAHKIAEARHVRLGQRAPEHEPCGGGSHQSTDHGDLQVLVIGCLLLAIETSITNSK